MLTKNNSIVELKNLVLNNKDKIFSFIDFQRELDESILYYYSSGEFKGKVSSELSFLMDIILNKKAEALEFLLSEGLILTEKEISLLYIMSESISNSRSIINYLEHTELSTKDLLLNIFMCESDRKKFFNKEHWKESDAEFIQKLFSKNYGFLSRREMLNLMDNCFYAGNGDSGLFIYSLLDEKDKKTFLKINRHKDLNSFLEMVLTSFYNNTNAYTESIFNEVSEIIRKEVNSDNNKLGDYLLFLNQSNSYIRDIEKKERIQILMVSLEKIVLSNTVEAIIDKNLKKRL